MTIVLPDKHYIGHHRATEIEREETKKHLEKRF